MDIKVILASASPRRLELLRQVGIEPVVEPSHVEEVITSMEPDKAVMELSAQKAKDLAALHAGEEAVVLGADTVAAADGLRMRSGPGTDFGRVATVPTGTQVTALGVDGTDGWILVQYSGAYGWLTKQYLTAN